MKKTIPLLLLAMALTTLLGGCIKDQCKNTYTYTYYQPVYKTTAQVRANIRSNAPRAIEKPGKIYVRAPYIFLNEIDKGIHIIDNSNPANPINKAFIDIPGNMDIAVKGNTLYADLYTDMISLDISNPLSVTVTKILDGVFPYRYYGGFRSDSSKVIADWIKRDTTVTEDCNGGNRWLMTTDSQVFMSYSSAGGSGTKSVSPVGMGGSMARFAIVSERLYTVSNSDLNVFNISNAAQPSFSKKTNVGWNIETLYPFKDNLFIGSTTGMFVYNIGSPDNPVKMGQFSHVQSCDPVIADDDYAYVTLRSGTTCRGFTNQMDVLQLNTFTNPTLVKSYPLTNPHGLSKDGNLLLVCDGKAGLKVYNASNASNLQLLSTVGNIETYDVITLNGTAIVVAKDGLYQYNYSNPSNLSLLSKLTILN
ncbi:MAG TPA: hypothetical protein VM884_01495 [Flavisolibacter sp.]|jgi:hypothetical protein|nr:hypothetical protein [Flavisolibacter sp.]